MSTPTVQRPLRRTVGRLDAVAFVITAVVVLDTIGAVAAGGFEAVLWLAVMGATFLLPSALVIAELSAAYPEEGGHYVWASRAFGRTAGAVSALLYWVESPIWIGGSLAVTTVAVIDRFAFDVTGGALLAVALAFVGATCACALAPMRIGRLVAIAGAVARFAVLGGFTLAVCAYAVRFGVHGLPRPRLTAPSWEVFAAVAPVLLYNYLGFDVPATAGGEVRDPQRTLPRAVLHGGSWTFALYAVPVVVVLCVLPGSTVSSLTGFIDGIGAVFGAFGRTPRPDGGYELAGLGLVLGDLCAAGVVVVLVTSGATWLMGAVRSQSVACLDGAGPRWLGETRRDGTPQRLVLVSAAVAVATAVGAYAVAGASADRYFAAALSLAIGSIALSYVAVFAALPALRRLDPGRPRPYRIPAGAPGALLAAGVSLAWTVGSLAFLLWPTTLPSAFQDDRAAFELALLLPLLALLATGLAFAEAGRRHAGRTRPRGAAPPATVGGGEGSGGAGAVAG